jgi:hypothetical protein
MKCRKCDSSEKMQTYAVFGLLSIKNRFTKNNFSQLPELNA